MKKIVLVFSVLLLLCGCAKKNIALPEEGKDNYIVFNDEVVNELIIRDHNIAYYDNLYHVYMNICNENNSDVTYKSITIEYYKDNVLIYSTFEDLNTISANKEKDISFDIDINLVNANKVKYSLTK